MENEWQMLEDDAGTNDGSSLYSAGPAAETAFGGIQQAGTEWYGDKCNWKLLHQKIHSMAWTRLADGQAL